MVKHFQHAFGISVRRLWVVLMFLLSNLLACSPSELASGTGSGYDRSSDGLIDESLGSGKSFYDGVKLRSLQDDADNNDKDGNDKDIDTGKDTSKSSSSSSSSSPHENHCASDDASYDYMLRLSDNLWFYWSLKFERDIDRNFLLGHLVYLGQGWIAWGVTTSGGMVGAEAVIGLPDLRFKSGATPLKYDLDSKYEEGVVPMEDSLQTLIDHSVTQDRNKTTLTFTKILEEEDEIPIRASGTNTFIWAVGSSNALSHHSHRGVVNLDLTHCTPIATKSRKNMSVWVAHGVLSTLAWAVAAPFAIATAWFRRLVPTGWIYIHVLANVTCFLFTLITFLIAISATSYKDHFTEPHHKVGLLIFLLVTVQVMGGFLRPPVEKVVGVDNSQNYNFFRFPKSNRQIWHFLHSSTGMLLLSLSIYQIQSGLKMFSQDFGTKSAVPFYWVYFALFALAVFVIKIRILCDTQWQENDDSPIVKTMDNSGYGDDAYGGNERGRMLDRGGTFT